jgi:multidrug efflux pump subunit AcrA (membrane-fusion protein)
MAKVGLRVVLGLLVVAPSLALALPWNESTLVPLEIASEQAPASISAPFNARVKTVLVHDRQGLEKGTPIVVLEDQSETGSTLQLAAYIRDVERWLAGNDQMPQPAPIAASAALQQRYTNLLASTRELHLAFRQDPDLERKRSLTRQIGSLRTSSVDLGRRYALSQQARALAEEKLKSRSGLVDKGWFAPDALIDDRTRVVRAEMEQSELAIESRENRRRIEELSGDIKSLEEDRAVRHADLAAKVGQDLASLEGALEQELARRVVRSPVAGKVKFSTRVEPGMALKESTEIAVISRESGVVTGRGRVGPGARTSVVPGQPVYLEFASFPAAKYGFVRGRVSQVAAVARDGQLEIQIAFPDGLKTERGFDIPFRERMVGTARVITRGGRVWERIVGRVRNAAA